MTAFWQGAAAVLLTVILALALGKQGKELSLLLTLAVCCMVGCVAMSYFQPVVDFLHRLQEIGKLDGGMLEILLKAVGIGLIGEIAGLICTDSGNGALGKLLQLLSGAVILWLSIPMLTQLLDLLQDILGEV
jgi:stage III sporulation protein AD